MQQIGLGHPSLRRAHFMPMMNCWWKGRLKGKSILKGIILHSWRGLPQKDRKIQKQLEEDQAKPSVQCWIAYPEQQSQENSVSSGIKGYCGWVWRILLVSFCCSLFFVSEHSWISDVFLDVLRMPALEMTFVCGKVVALLTTEKVIACGLIICSCVVPRWFHRIERGSCYPMIWVHGKFF